MGKGDLNVLQQLFLGNLVTFCDEKRKARGWQDCMMAVLDGCLGYFVQHLRVAMRRITKSFGWTSASQVTLTYFL